MLGEGLFSLLASAPSITALIGTPATRSDQTAGIFPVQMPEASPLPAIVFFQISGSGDVTMDGASALLHSRFQFSCYGTGYADAKRLARALRQLLDGLNTTLPDGTQVDVATLILESDTFNEAPFIYHTPLDIEFWFREPD